MPIGVPINSLQDLIMLRELRNQSNPTYSAMKALSDGVALGISEKQEEAKNKRKQEDAFAKAQEVANTNSSKITTKIDEEGNQSYSIISGTESALKPTATQITASNAGIIQGLGKNNTNSDFGLLDDIARGVQEDERKESIADAAEAKSELQQQSFKNTNVLRDDFVKVSGDFFKIQDSFGRIIASAEDPSAAGDLALIFNYMKMLDPASVVRESEFATAQNAGSVPERVRAAYNNALEGTRLDPNVRNDFVDRAKKLFASQKDIQNGRIKEYTNRSNRYGLNSADVISEIPEYDLSGLATKESGGKDFSKLWNISPGQ